MSILNAYDTHVTREGQGYTDAEAAYDERRDNEVYGEVMSAWRSLATDYDYRGSWCNEVCNNQGIGEETCITNLVRLAAKHRLDAISADEFARQAKALISVELWETEGEKYDRRNR